MIDLFLKFPDEATAQAVLFDDEALRFQTSVDIIGVIYKPTGVMLTSEEGEYPEMAPLDGWHVNLRGVFTQEQMTELAAFQVAPTNPVRVWA